MSPRRALFRAAVPALLAVMIARLAFAFIRFDLDAPGFKFDAAPFLDQFERLARNLNRVDPDEPGFNFKGSTAYDRFERLARYPGKTPAICPAQNAPNARVAVIAAIGQSNIANYGLKSARSDFPDRVFNFFNGFCFAAQSPFLGAEGVKGEWLTLLGDAMIRSGRYDFVTIAPAAIGGVNIRSFADGDLTPMLDDTIRKLAAANQRPTHVIWHQGESDFYEATPASRYRSDFLKIAAGLRAHAINAPIFISVTTRCLPRRADWTPDNEIAQALRDLPAQSLGLWSGADSDAFDPTTSHYDGCHLSAQGQELLAARYGDIFAAWPINDDPVNRLP